MVNHLWRQYGPRPAPTDAAGEPGPAAQLAGFAVTFLAVVVAMVLFRAPDLAAAGNLLGGMVGLHGLGMPGTRFGAAGMHLLDGSVPVHAFASAAAILLALLAIALLLPNSVQILAAYEPVLYTPKRAAEIPGVLRPVLPRAGPLLAWRPTAGLDGALRRPRRGVDDPAHRHERVPVLAVLRLPGGAGDGGPPAATPLHRRPSHTRSSV